MSNPIGDAQRYVELGVSATKTDVYGAIKRLPSGVSDKTFCNVIIDPWSNDQNNLMISHSDGAGSKSILAYLYHKTTGSLKGYKNIAIDSIVMNLDDMICVGVTTGFLLTSTINRNARRISGEVLRTLINAKLDFTDLMRDYGVDICFLGGETADIGDVVQTLLVDANMSSVFHKDNLIENSISPMQDIVGFESSGPPAIYESDWNSGIGSNGITLARHELMGGGFHKEYPEIYDISGSDEDLYTGPYSLSDILPNTSVTVLEALLSPTRTFAPVMRHIYKLYKNQIFAAVHNTGGGHTKCLRFAKSCRIEKDFGNEIPQIFMSIKDASGLPWNEMAKIFNLGYRFEVYCEPSITSELIEVSSEFGIKAKKIGVTSPSKNEQGVELNISLFGNCYTIK